MKTGSVTELVLYLQEKSVLKVGRLRQKAATTVIVWFFSTEELCSSVCLTFRFITIDVQTRCCNDFTMVEDRLWYDILYECGFIHSTHFITEKFANALTQTGEKTIRLFHSLQAVNEARTD